MRQSRKTFDPSKAEVAGYAADMLTSLRRLSEASGMPLLAHLVDLACAEAMRNAHAEQIIEEDALDSRDMTKLAPQSCN